MPDPSHIPTEVGDSVPAGAWAVGVSGGADSVALLHLLHQRTDLRLVVVHLNHQTRAEESDADEHFVLALARELKIECRTATRADIEPILPDLPANPSARYRRLRFAHFGNVVRSDSLQGVILAHHANDQAETVLQRLLRGSSYSGLAGMSSRATVDGVNVLRPLLAVRRSALREYLRARDVPWREDASNASPDYLRNRLRPMLETRPDVFELLLAMSRACRALRNWTELNAPKLESEFAARVLADLPPILARHASAHWLTQQGSPASTVDRGTIDRLAKMCADAATPSRQQFPGGISVRRRSGRLRADDGAAGR